MSSNSSSSKLPLLEEGSALSSSSSRSKLTLFDAALLGPAIVASFQKLAPRTQLRNPVMFVVYVGSILTTLLFFQAWFGKGEASPGFILGISIWLWFTVLFANFAEALAEGAAMVIVPLIFDSGRSAKANLSLDSGLLRAIDEAAEARGLTRSAFIATAARQKISTEG